MQNPTELIVRFFIQANFIFKKNSVIEELGSTNNVL